VFNKLKLKAILAFKKKAHNSIGVQILSLEIHHHHNQMGESPPFIKAVVSFDITMSVFGILSDVFVSFLQVTQMATWGK